MMEVLGGTAGWSYADWYGPFYPEKKEKGFSELGFYADFFDCVEVNSSFYRHFPSTTAEKWLMEVRRNPNFVFIVKLFKEFTHGNRGRDEEFLKNKRAVLEFLAPFQERRKLGGVLVQFSEYFRESDHAMAYISLLNDTFHDVQLFFELRHVSWYTHRASEFLGRNGINVIAIDQPQLKGMAGFDTEMLNGIGYVRLHGRNLKMWETSRRTLRGEAATPVESEVAERNKRYDYLYSTSELDEVERKIRTVQERCARTYLIMNNHPLGKAVANALDLVRRLRGQEKIRMPETVLRFFPELGKIAERVDVNPLGNLFEG